MVTEQMIDRALPSWVVLAQKRNPQHPKEQVGKWDEYDRAAVRELLEAALEEPAA